MLSSCGCWTGIQCTISDSVKFTVLNTFLQDLTLKIFKIYWPCKHCPILRFRFGNNCEIQSEIYSYLLWTGNFVCRRCFPPPSAWNSGNHRIRIKTEAKANCRRCFSGGKWLPTASITVRLCSRRVNTGGLGQ